MTGVYAIVNPAGRDGVVAKRWPKIAEQMRAAGIELDYSLTEYVNHAAKIAFELREKYANTAENERPLIVAVGGDGTVHEVASGLRGGNLKMGIIPHGTGNDYARGHGYPMKNIATSIDILINGKDRSSPAIRLEAFPMPARDGYPSPSPQIWDGEAEDSRRVVRWVFLESDGGVTAQVSRRKLYQGKWIRGPMKYTYLGLRAILGAKKQDMWVKIDGGEPVTGPCDIYALTTVETYGGGFKVCPGMHIERTPACFIKARKLSKFQMLNLMGPLKKGKHIGKMGITQQFISELEIRPLSNSGEPMDEPGALPYITQSDGEPQLQAPSSFKWFADQLVVRGAQVLPHERK